MVWTPVFEEGGGEDGLRVRTLFTHDTSTRYRYSTVLVSIIISIELPVPVQY